MLYFIKQTEEFVKSCETQQVSSHFPQSQSILERSDADGQHDSNLMLEAILVSNTFSANAIRRQVNAFPSCEFLAEVTQQWSEVSRMELRASAKQVRRVLL